MKNLLALDKKITKHIMRNIWCKRTSDDGRKKDLTGFIRHDILPLESEGTNAKQTLHRTDRIKNNATTNGWSKKRS